MSRQELDLAVDWAAAEGWNPGLHDANCFYAIDPNGFLIGLLETNRLPCCGLINTLASSGSVISVPVLLMLGLSLLEANATRRRFRRRLLETLIDCVHLNPVRAGLLDVQRPCQL